MVVASSTGLMEEFITESTSKIKSTGWVSLVGPTVGGTLDSGLTAGSMVKVNI